MIGRQLYELQRKLLVWLVIAGLAGELAVVIGANAKAEQQYLLTPHWTIENGLPGNTLISLIQTRDGYIWMGTKAGLARFDGVRFKVFNEDLLFREGGDLRCLDLTEDTEGRVWVRMADGLVCYDHGKFRKFPIGSLPWRGVIQTMTASSRGGLWIGTQTDGLKLFVEGRCIREWRVGDGLARNLVGLLCEDEEGGLWIGSGQILPVSWIEKWQRLDPGTGVFKTLEQIVGREIDDVGEVRAASGGQIWIATPNELFCFKDEQLSAFHNPGLWMDRRTGELIEAGKNDLWFAPPFTEQLVHFENGAFQRFGMEHGLADSDIRPLLWDREGNLWVGYGAGGLQKLRPRGVMSFLETNETGVRQQIDSISIGLDGSIWLGTWSGLLRWNGDSVAQLTNRTRGRQQNARPVLVDHTGQVWLGRSEHGLMTLESNRIVPVPAADDGRTNWTIRTLFEDRLGTLWIGSGDGLLQKREGKFLRYSVRDGLLDDDILGILDAPDGSLWVGTRKGGIHQFRNGKFVAFTVNDGLMSNEATPLLVEDDGTAWAGTPKGLNRINSRGKTGTVTEREGLLQNEIFCLLDDGAGYYWANSARGIFRVRKADLHAVADGKQRRLFCVSYGEADGATSAEGCGEYQPNACRTTDGRMWFSTTRGVAVIDPARLRQREIPPPVVIEEVYADERLIFSDGSVPNGWSYAATRGVRIPPARAHGLEIRYTANTFVATEKVKFRHRLEGADGQWRDAGTRRTAFYTNLRPGSYQFNVEASTQEGTRSERPAVFSFYVEPAFTQRPWFPALCALALLGASGGIAFWRLRWQKRVLLAEQNASVQGERARIARDLHDDLGTALTGLALELDVIRRDAQAVPSTSNRLSATARHTRQLAERMREVVWAVNPRCDTVSSLADFLEQQSAQFLQADGIRGRLEFPDEIPDSHIDSESRHQLILVMREALTNVMRHAAATQVVIKMTFEESFLMLQVIDNGCGFKADPVIGHGLHNIGQRLKRIGAVFSCESAPGHGTTLSFRIPLAGRAPAKKTVKA